MHLVYLDESGNTGNNLADAQQPLFVLGALIVPSACWKQLELDLEQSIQNHFPEVAAKGIEIKGSELRNAQNEFRGCDVTLRISLRDTWMRIAQNHGLKFIYRAIEKARFQRWVQSTFGAGISINPHVAAFPLVARVVDDYLRSVSEDALGMFISDENKEVMRDIEKSIRVLRVAEGSLQLAAIIEKGFFIDSKASRPLQLCDICTLAARKLEEAALGITTTKMDDSAREPLAPLIHRGDEAFLNVMKWLVDERRNAQ